MSSRDIRRGSGFTLIELLVVIAIIAILAAILFPVFAKAREKARIASCTSNLKNLATAVMQYNSDYDGLFPLRAPTAATDNPGQFFAVPGTSAWPNAMQPYLKNYTVLSCPSSRDFNPFNTASTAHLTYTFNGIIGSYPESGITAPSRTIAFWEQYAQVRIQGAVIVAPHLFGNPYAAGSGFPYRYQPVSAPCATTASPRQFALYSYIGWPIFDYNHHNLGSNFIYADGHVKWQRTGSRNSAYASSTPTGNSFWVEANPNCLDPLHFRPDIQ